MLNLKELKKLKSKYYPISTYTKMNKDTTQEEFTNFSLPEKPHHIEY